MAKAKLYTREGRFVADVDMPPFNPPADVVVWGTRHFVFRRRGEGGDTYDDYFEGMAWHCTEPQPVPTSDELTAVARARFNQATGTTVSRRTFVKSPETDT